jgi:hypothetical protein
VRRCCLPPHQVYMSGEPEKSGDLYAAYASCKQVDQVRLRLPLQSHVCCAALYIIGDTLNRPSPSSLAASTAGAQ